MLLTVVALLLALACIGACMYLIRELVKAREELVEVRDELSSLQKELNLYRIYTVDPHSRLIQSLPGPVSFSMLLHELLNAASGGTLRGAVMLAIHLED